MPSAVQEPPRSSPVEASSSPTETHSQIQAPGSLTLAECMSDPSLTSGFILGRFERLKEGGIQEDFNNPLPFTADFLAPQTAIYANPGFGSAFQLDDEQLYKLFAEKLERLIEANAPKEIASEKIVLYAVAVTLCEYFGSATPSRGSKERRLSIYDEAPQVDSGGSQPLSISCFKGNDAAECAERAAAAHNLLLLAGTASILFTCNTAADGQSIPHLANLLNSRSGWQLHDPTNPQMVYESAQRGQVIAIRPSVFSLTPDEALNLLNDTGTFSAAYFDFARTPDGTKEIGLRVELDFSAQTRPVGYTEAVKRLVQ